MKTHRLTYQLTLLAFFIALIVIAMGAFTRLSHAGLGCPDWPTCYGHILWPDAEHEIYIANQRFDETPVDTNKTWPEQVHRLLASSLGLFSLLIFFSALRRSKDKALKTKVIFFLSVFLLALVSRIFLAAQWKITAAVMYDFFDISIAIISVTILVALMMLGIKKSHYDVKTMLVLPALIVAFVILQGLFGMWTVTLKVWPQVVTIHLLGGFTVLSLLWLAVLRLRQNMWQIPYRYASKIPSLKTYAAVVLLIVVTQIALGGWTTSNYAAVACPELPTCQNQWWPQMDFKKAFDIGQAIGPNYLGGQMDNSARMAIHMSHRIGAVITTLAVIFLALLLLQLRQKAVTRMAYVALGILALQIALGLSNILFHFPISIAVLHNAVGALLLLSMVTVNYQIRTSIIQESDDE